MHRSIISILNNKKHKLHNLPDTALHISETERRAMLAERDAADRYKVSFMAKKIGDVFAGVISGLNEYGLFVSLNETGITGFIPVRNLGRDFFIFDRKNSCFIGRGSKDIFALGAAIVVRVQEANSMTGSLIFVPESAPMQGTYLPKDRPRRGHERPEKSGKRRDNKKHVGKNRKKR